MSLNARKPGNIKKSGKVLNCWIAWKAGSKGTLLISIYSLIASNVLENSSIVTQTEAAGVDCHT